MSVLEIIQVYMWYVDDSPHLANIYYNNFIYIYYATGKAGENGQSYHRVAKSMVIRPSVSK
jgi:hypothetical protein